MSGRAPSVARVGGAEQVVASVRRFGTAKSVDERRRAVAQLRFICRQNIRSVEHAHQSAAGNAHAIELLAEALGYEQSDTDKRSIVRLLRSFASSIVKTVLEFLQFLNC